MRLILRVLLVCAMVAPLAAPAVDSCSDAGERSTPGGAPEVVILLHGLARSHF